MNKIAQLLRKGPLIPECNRGIATYSLDKKNSLKLINIP